MYEAIVYDRRDIQSDHPSSTLGSYDTPEAAWNAIVEYIRSCSSENLKNLYRSEVLPIQ